MKKLFLIPLILIFSSLIIYLELFNSGKVKENTLTGKGLQKKLVSLSVPFIQNQGQIDSNVKFYAKTFSGTVFLTKDGEIVYSLPKKEGKEKFSLLVFKEIFPKIKKVQLKGEDESKTRVSYFKGNDEKNWKTNLKTFNWVKVGQIAKGVELKVKAYGKKVEKFFYVKPEGNPESIKVKLEGISGLEINKAGELVVNTQIGKVKFTYPVAYQYTEKGKKKFVNVEYAVLDRNTYSFRVKGSYDKNKTLIIDPVLASTFLGGTQEDRAYSMAIDSGGNIIVAGNSYSTDYPVVSGAYQTSPQGFPEIVVSKISGDLTTLLASTYIGGSGGQTAYSVAVDSSDNIIIVGYTSSNDYPTTPTTYSTLLNGSTDIVITKFKSDLTSLVASTYFGGSSGERALSVTLDSSDNIILTGYTYSSNFPTSPPAYNRNFAGGITDIFVTKFKPDLSTFLASTYIGGTGTYEEGKSVAVDSFGNIIIVGYTDANDYPTTPPVYSTSNSGHEDIVITKFDSNLSSLVASTYFGGLLEERAFSVTLDSSDNIIITGYTRSSNFPTSPPAYNRNLTGSSDIFVTKFKPDLSTFLASTYIGGNSYEEAYSVVLDSSGNIFITGKSNSDNYPTTSGAYSPTKNSQYDIVLTKLNSDLSDILASTFIGGSGNEEGHALVVDGSDNIYVAGFSDSTDYITTDGVYDSTSNSIDIVISKLSNDLSNGIPYVNSFSVNPSYGDIPLSVTFSWNVSDVDDKNLTCYIDVDSDGVNDYTINDCKNNTTQTHTYGLVGIYNAKFTVSDSKGSSSVSISLRTDLPLNNSPVINSFTPTPSSGNEPLTVTFNWNVSDVDGDTLICKLDIDNDGNDDYTINDCGNNTSQQHTYNNSGYYTATLIVYDGNGGAANRTISVYVKGSSKTESDGGNGCNTLTPMNTLFTLIVPLMLLLRRFVRND
ncbi:hypothetical protein GWK41_01275 [Persephonella atlantica]|uniref:PKD domain-containing protein n=1 Tax=Persephonella atlantica TaxID=2699429 RepID=A0ABS1GFJ5_9AQUI|nr:SBBP repeat-containing protein [Persephonella atlantica]MBK3331694.1 hypothetical protein [Persephonella atlantica]